jgi:hypothetical protein
LRRAATRLTRPSSEDIREEVLKNLDQLCNRIDASSKDNRDAIAAASTESNACLLDQIQIRVSDSHKFYL